MQSEALIVPGSKSIRGNFRLAPINIGGSTGGVPSDSLLRFHELRSGKGIAISMVGNVAVDVAHSSNDATPTFERGRMLWPQLIESVSGNGSLPGIQLAASQLPSPSALSWKNAGSNRIIVTRDLIGSMQKAEIDDIIKKFQKYVAESLCLGFELVQIHAAHGYFLSLLLDPRFNERQDEYSVKDSYVINLIVEAFRQHVNKCEWRLSFSQGIGDEREEFELFERTLDKLHAAGVRNVSVSDGYYDYSRAKIYPPRGAAESRVFWNHREMFENIFDMHFDFCGNVSDLLRYEELPKKYSFSIGRNLIANPQFIQDYYNADGADGCHRTGKCHFYSRGERKLSCGVNPNL